MTYRRNNAGVEIIKLDIPDVATEWRRQRDELSAKHEHEFSNQMFVAYLLDIRKEALGSIQAPNVLATLVDEHAKEILDIDDTEPRGTVQ